MNVKKTLISGCCDDSEIILHSLEGMFLLELSDALGEVESKEISKELYDLLNKELG